MGYVFLAFLIVVIGFSVFKMKKKKSLPSNQYTPYDDITMGKKIEVKHDGPLQDSKHKIEYHEDKK